MSTIAEQLFREIAEDEQIAKATREFALLKEKSDVVATKVLETLLADNAECHEFTLDELTLGLARSMMYLTHLFFEHESQHQEVEQFVLDQLSRRVFDTIFSPQACLTCENCHNGRECQNLEFPSIPFATIPILSSVLIEEVYLKACLNNSIAS